MTSERACYVYIVPPDATEFVTAGRFKVFLTTAGDSVGQFFYGRRYLERNDAVELDPVELRLRRGPYETARMEGFFGAIRDAILHDDPNIEGSIARQVEEFLLVGTSLGGARPKAGVEHRQGLWIAKFSRQDDR